MIDTPIIRFEVEGLKTNVIHIFSNMSDDFKKLVISTIEETLTAEWVQQEVNYAVNQCIRGAIARISDNYQLQSAISEKISEAITEIIKDKENAD